MTSKYSKEDFHRLLNDYWIDANSNSVVCLQKCQERREALQFGIILSMFLRVGPLSTVVKRQGMSLPKSPTFLAENENIVSVS